MAGLNRNHMAALRGASRLAFDATAGLVDLVEQMHHTIQRRPGPIGRFAAGSTEGVTGLVYRSVRGGVGLAGQGIDALLAPLGWVLPQGASSPLEQAARAAVNGVRGDYLARTGNPLAIAMSLRHRGGPLDPVDPAAVFREAGDRPPGAKIVVLVHGLCMNDLQWTRDGFDHGAALADDLGCTPLYLRYNSGLAVGENGRDLATLLETVLAHWPTPVQELTILGHSMGGLVARSACEAAAEQRHAWVRRLRNLVFLGTPHHGSPLERGSRGLFFLMDLSPYLAPFTRLGKSVSAGIQDLHDGSITTGGYRFVPLPAGVNCYAVAATLAKRRSPVADRLVGDGLVPLGSALGQHADPDRTLAFAPGCQWVGYEMGHLQLLWRPEVRAQLRHWLGAAA